MVEQPTPLGDYEPIKKKEKKGLRINAPLVSRSSEQGAYDCCTLNLPLRPGISTLVESRRMQHPKGSAMRLLQPGGLFPYFSTDTQ